ncbi:MAG: NAD(P)/FAD-dependent oxidoreductase [Oligoflexia bacterium]|nr:NAD(P)/FAD-dependent oxidoreductase [Oligoflexia bacterium]
MILKKEDAPSSTYDVIVIGGGLGGMSVANILAKNGRKVLLVEAHNKLGGLATWFRRSSCNHIFDVSLHGFPYGMVKSLNRYWSKKISDMVTNLTDIRFINPQYSITTNYTKDDFLKILNEKFNISSENAENFFNHVMKIGTEYDSNRTAEELFNSFFPARPDIIRFLMEPITYANGHLLEDPALSYGIVFANFMKNGIYTVAGGTDKFIKAMQDELLQNGVDIKLHTKVKRIDVQNKNVQGVFIGEHLIKSKIVVSNGNIVSTIKEMVGEKHFSKEFFENTNQVRLNTSSCQVYIGIKEGEIIPNIGDLIFYSDAKTFNTQELLNMKISSRTFSVYYPKTRPEHNRYAVVASTNAKYEDWKKLSSTEYEKAKQDMVEDTLNCLEKFIPNVRGKVDHLEAATPLTFERYTSHLNGASFGTKYEGLAISRGLHKEIEGLFHCGSVGIIMSGWLGALNYAAITANDIEATLSKSF